MRWAWLVVLLGGCDLVFQIESRAAHEVEIVERRLLHNPDHTPFIQESPFDPADLELRLIDADGITLAIDRDGDVYRFATNGPYRLIVTNVRDLQTTEYQLATERVKIAITAIGRTDYAVGGPNADVIVDATNIPFGGGQAFAVFALGVPGTPVVSEQPPPLTIGWKDRPLVDRSRGDRLYVVHSRTNGSFDLPEIDFVTVMDYALAVDADMAPNGATRITTVPALQPTKKCANLDLPRADETQRLEAIWGTAASSKTAQWTLGTWFPGASLDAFQSIIANFRFGTMVNIKVPVMYDDPYPHAQRAVQLAASTFEQVPGKLQIGVESYHMVVVENCPAMTLALDRVAIANHIAIAGVELAMDEQRVRIDREQPVTFTWQTTTDGRPGAYFVDLFEVIDIDAQQYDRPNFVARYVTNEPSVRVQERDLATGTQYSLTVSVLPTVDPASGDLRTEGASATRRWSRTFRVEN